MVEKNELSAGHARALISITDDKKQLDAATEVREKGLSVRKTEQLAAKLSREVVPEKENNNSVSVDYAAEISDQLSKALGRKVKLTDGKKTGKIEIEFYGADDRENLIELLRGLGK